MIVVGIDPGAGSSSPTGIVKFNSNTKAIYEARGLLSHYESVDNRIWHLSQLVFDFIVDGPPVDLVCIETTVMQGKGGQTYQKLVGGIVAAVPIGIPIQHVFNVTMKKLVGGHGKADKMEVADGVYKYFHDNPRSKKLIELFIKNEEWDVTDAGGVGIAGLEVKNGK